MLVWVVGCCAWLVSDVVVPRYRGDLGFNCVAC